MCQVFPISCKAPAGLAETYREVIVARQHYKTALDREVGCTGLLAYRDTDDELQIAEQRLRRLLSE